LSLAEVIPIEPEPVYKLCELCGETKLVNAFPPSARDPDTDDPCNLCKTFQAIDAPDELVPALTILNMDVNLPDEWAGEMAPGMVFKAELVLHVDQCEAKRHNGETRWRARWLEVTRLYD